MKQQTSLNRKLETVISLWAVLVIIFVVVAILLMQGRYNMSAFGINPEVSQEKNTAPDVFFAVSDAFEVFSPAEHYGPDELYEKIDGKAPLYTDAGFEMLDTQRFTFKASPQCWVEVYRYQMTTPQSAFCVYSTQRRPSGKPVEGISAEHSYKTTSGMYLAAGNNYFEISASVEDEAVLDALRGCLTDIAELDKPENAFMAMPKNLPDENAVVGTFKLYLDGAFGIGGLGQVYMRDYVLDGQRLVAFSIGDGKAAMAAYEKFMEENGAEKISEKDGIITYDLFGVYEIIALAGDNLVGVHEADDADAGVRLVKSIRQKR